MTGPTLQRLSAFYKACIEEEDRHRLELDPQAFGKAFFSPHYGSERLLSKGQEKKPTASAVASFVQKAEDDASRPLTYGYPLWRSAQTGAVVPLFVIEVEVSGGVLQVAGDAVVNYRVLLGHGISDEEASDVISRLQLEDASIPFRTRLERALDALTAPPGAIDPEHTLPFSRTNKDEWHNVGVLFQGGSLYTANLRRELDALQRFGFLANDAPSTALAALTTPAVHAAVSADRRDDVPDGHEPRLAEVLPLNDGQELAARAALDAPLTVVTGPPGTGKSQVVVALLASAVRSGQSVLFASKNRKAVDVVRDRLREVLGHADLSLRLGARDLMESGEAEIRQLTDAAVASPVHPPPVDADRLARGRLLALRTAESTRRKAVAEEEAAAAAVPADWRSVAPPSPDALLPASALRQETELCRVLASGEWPGLLLWIKKTFLGARLRLQTLARLDAAAEACPPPVRKALVPSDPTFEALHRSFQSLLAYRTWADACTTLQAATQVLQESAAPEPDYPSALYAIKREIADVERARVRAHWVRTLRSDIPETKAALDGYFGTVSAFWKLVKDKGFRTAVTQLTSAQQRAARLFPVWAVNNLSVRNALPLQPALFDLVVIDEASQCDLASAIPLLYRARRAVVIGDPYQLRHITSVGEEAEARFAKRASVTDLLPRLSYVRNSTYDATEAALSEAGGHRVFLREHYRCHPEIAAFPARVVYKGRDQLLVRTTPEQYAAHIPPALHGLVWYHVAGQARRVRSSWINDAEIDAVVRLLTEWSAAGHLASTDLSIGIVTPFRSQADAIRDRVRKLDLWAGRIPPTVGTAHAFQGDERDIIVLSPVVASGIYTGTASWVSREVNLLNVAVTRARAGLHVVGDEGACRDTGGALRDLVACARLRASDGVPNGVGPDNSLNVSTG